MKITTIASGSSGNCIYVGSEKRNFIFDAGISLKRIEEGLAAIDLKPSDLDGIFISHEHSDHIGGLGVLLRKYEVPVYLTEGTYDAIREKNLIGSVPDDFFNVIRKENEISVGDMKIEAYGVSHDAAEPVVYKAREGDSSFSIITDLGTYDDALVERLSGLDAALIETNHDIRMLQVGPYPYVTKQRILGEKGHLSNEAGAELLKKIYSPKLKEVLLGHISKSNNYEELAHETVRLEMQFSHMEADVQIAPRSENSKTIEI